MGAAASKGALLGLLCAACASVAVDARTFEGTRWHVIAVNGQPTPPGGDYRLEFKDGGVGGRFGCNSFGGRYSVAGETLVAADVASTRMGCPEPSATLESAGLRVLSKPMHWTWVAGLKMTLQNDAGSIALERMR